MSGVSPQGAGPDSYYLIQLCTRINELKETRPRLKRACLKNHFFKRIFTEFWIQKTDCYLKLPAEASTGLLLLPWPVTVFMISTRCVKTYRFCKVFLQTQLMLLHLHNDPVECIKFSIYLQIDAYLEELAATYPNLVTLVVAGYSFEGRVIKYWKISTTNFQVSFTQQLYINYIQFSTLNIIIELY